jgi:pyruvate-formate lyase-activating enzyme
MSLEKSKLYRLPWALNDNPIGWLEVTDICNMHCEGCYRQHLSGHKSLDEIKEEVRLFKQWRNCDNISIAGGEPLVHPKILEIVAHISESGLKPILLSNGAKLDRPLLEELKRAGLDGFTLHIDSQQARPGWTGKNEGELNALREHYADLIADVGGMSVIFNSTVYPSTFEQIPDVVRWGQQHIERVQGLVFITYRTATTDLVGQTHTGQTVDLGELSYTAETFDEEFVLSNDIHALIQKHIPEYDAACYLGGTVKTTSFKWLMGAVIGSRHKLYGAVGPKTMELGQTFHHLFRSRYMAYLANSRIGKKLFLLGLWDPAVRHAASRFMRDVLARPSRILDDIHVQAIGIIQAPDLLPDGRVDMCDSCPDMTWYNGQLINSCRMDELRLFGEFLTVTTAEKSQETQTQRRKDHEK